MKVKELSVSYGYVTKRDNKDASLKQLSELTQGSVLKKLLLFVLPIFGANVLQAMYGTVDLIVVGYPILRIKQIWILRRECK